MDHFLESRRHLGPLVEPFLAAFAARGGDPELLRPILDVRPGYLEAALDEVRSGYGSIERYFSDGLDIDEATQGPCGRPSPADAVAFESRTASSDP